jgi:hypothetical protein
VSLLYLDGFDHYSSLEQKWDDAASASISSVGRNGTSGATGSIGNFRLTKNVEAQTPTMLLGFGFKVSNGGFGGLCGFGDSNGTQVSLTLQQDGRITIYRGAANSGGVLLGTSAQPMALGMFNYIEVKLVVGTGLLGSVTVNVNSTPFFAVTALNTQGGTNTYASRAMVGWSGVGSSGSISVDDVYIADGSDGSSFLGDIRVQTLLPTGPGNYTLWARGGDQDSGANWSQVEEGAPNDATDYIQSDTPGDRDTYVYGDLATAVGSVVGVQGTPRVKATNAGMRTVAVVSRVATTDAESEAQTVSTDWVSLPMQVPSPTGAAWTLDDVNNAEFGVRLIT